MDAGVGVAGVCVGVEDELVGRFVSGGLVLCVVDGPAGADDATPPFCGWQPAAAMTAAAAMATGRIVRGRNSLVIGGFLSDGLLGR
jgi:hypothetical protein